MLEGRLGSNISVPTTSFLSLIQNIQISLLILATQVQKQFYYKRIQLDPTLIQQNPSTFLASNVKFLIIQQTQQELNILFYNLNTINCNFSMASINYSRIKQIARLRSCTFTESNPEKLLANTPLKNLQLQTNNKLRRSLFRSQFTSTPTNKVKTVSSSITRESSNNSQKAKTKCQLSQPELLHTEKFVINLCRNFEVNKFKILPSLTRGPEDRSYEDLKSHQSYKWSKIRTKILAKKYTLENGLQINDLGEQIKESNRQILKLRMRELQGEDQKQN